MGESGALGQGEFGQRGPDSVDLGRSDDQRGKVRLREVAVVVGLFFAALRDRNAARLIPAEGFLNNFPSGAQNAALAFDFVLESPEHPAEGVEVLDFRSDPERGRAAPAQGYVGLKADGALLHVATGHVQVAQKRAQGGGVGLHLRDRA